MGYWFAYVAAAENWFKKDFQRTLEERNFINGWCSFVSIKDCLESLGHKIECISEIKDEDYNLVDFFIFENIYDFHYEWYSKIVKKKLESRMIYSMFEPEVVMWWHNKDYAKKILRFFPAIMTWRPEIYKLEKCYESSIVSMDNTNISHSKVPFSKKKLLVLISVNGRSNHPNELYSQRRRVANWFDKNHPEEFDLFGPGWPENMRCYHGTCGNKTEVYHKYKFALTLENSVSEDYFDEKMISAWKSGIVPIYKGLENIHELIPYKCFIDYDLYMTKDGMERLYEDLSNMTESEYGEYLSEAKKALSSELVKKKLPEYYCEKLIEMADDLKNNSDVLRFRISPIKFTYVRLKYRARLAKRFLAKTKLWVRILRPIFRRKALKRLEEINDHHGNAS